LKILVRATNWLGDAVMSLPAIHALRGRYPDARLSVLARPWVADLYAREPGIDEVIPYSPQAGARDIAAKLGAARELRRRRFDLAVLLQNAFEAAAIAWLAGIPRRIGYNRDGRGWMLTDPVRVPQAGEIPRHERFYYLELLRRAGLIDSLPDVRDIRLAGAVEAAEEGARYFRGLSLEGEVIGVSPGAAYGNAKRWIPERFAEAARDLAEARGASVAVFGSAAERDLCERVASGGGVRAVNLAGRTTLREFISCAAACSLYLTNDSGAMHIAGALGVPTVAVFGATDHTTTGPSGSHTAVIREPVECSPCLLRECPIDHRCMTRVTVERVTEAGLELWKRGH
jgi:heptosyltransferase-2